MKALVVYFSTGGVTARMAKAVAEAAGADLFEIRPEKPYSDADLNWMNPMSRCNREKLGKKDVPVAGKVENMAEYDTLYVGFPIWYGCAPNVVNTFLKGCDLSGKKIYVFATSGGSGIGKSAEKLAPYAPGAEIADAKLLRSADEAKSWVKLK
jgi:flavodoxin